MGLDNPRFQGVRMKIIKLTGCVVFALVASMFLAACGSSGQAQMTPEKFKDMYGMLLKLDELKKKEIISEAEFQLQKKKLLGEEKAP
jgi:major membrane immunogen (membrane-anchored lipoprotein)